MKRVLGYLFAASVLLVGAGSAGASPSVSPAGGQSAGTPSESDETVVTLADDLDTSDCVSALPDPRCRTRDSADGMQLALFGVLVGAIALIGWRIGRSVRQRDRAQREIDADDRPPTGLR